MYGNEKFVLKYFLKFILIYYPNFTHSNESEIYLTTRVAVK